MIPNHTSYLSASSKKARHSLVMTIILFKTPADALRAFKSVTKTISMISSLKAVWNGRTTLENYGRTTLPDGMTTSAKGVKKFASP